MSRNGNGYGSCHKIGGKVKRAKPFRVRVTDGWEWDEGKQKAIQKYRTLGYYESRKEGLIALAEYNKNPAKRGTAELLFSDLYKLWFENKKPEGQAMRAYRNAYNQSAALHNMKVKDIKAEHLESVMNSVTVGVAGQKILKTFWNQVFDFAVGRDIIHKNYSKMVRTKDKDSRTSSRQPFTKEEIQLLWDNVDKIEHIDAILILIYTGMRPSELLGIHKDNVYCSERYMIGGIKTEAGKNRVIPIHKSVLPFIERRLQSSDYLVCDSENPSEPMSYDFFRRHCFVPVMKALGLEHTAHECRHTGISLMTMAGIDERLIKKIVGHSSGDITQRYTHAYIETLVEAIDKVDLCVL
ncbi:MAG: site-specific integrase [Ruminococcus sp.]|nr:site-specific integrase [Ruminococcus sp.]